MIQSRNNRKLLTAPSLNVTGSEGGDRKNSLLSRLVSAFYSGGDSQIVETSDTVCRRNGKSGCRSIIKSGSNSSIHSSDRPTRCSTISDTGGIDIRLAYLRDPNYVIGTTTGTLYKTTPGRLYVDCGNYRDHESYKKNHDVHSSSKTSVSVQKGGSGKSRRYPDQRIARCASGDEPSANPLHKCTENRQTSKTNQFSKKDAGLRNGCFETGCQKSIHHSGTSDMLLECVVGDLHFWGEVNPKYPRKREGWGTIISDKRVLFEGMWKNDIVYGWYICYHEWSTEIGYRDLHSFKAVHIINDYDCFIMPIQSSSRNDEAEETSHCMGYCREISCTQSVNELENEIQNTPDDRNKVNEQVNAGKNEVFFPDISEETSITKNRQPASEQYVGLLNDGETFEFDSLQTNEQPLIVLSSVKCVGDTTNINYNAEDSDFSAEKLKSIKETNANVGEDKKIVGNPTAGGTVFSLGSNDANKLSVTDGLSETFSNSRGLLFKPSTVYRRGRQKHKTCVNVSPASELTVQFELFQPAPNLMENNRNVSGFNDSSKSNRSGRMLKRGATFPECCLVDNPAKEEGVLCNPLSRAERNDKVTTSGSVPLMRASDCNNWSFLSLTAFLRMIGLSKEAHYFKQMKVSGSDILKIDDDFLFFRLGLAEKYTRKFILIVFRFLWTCTDHLDPLFPFQRRNLGLNSDKQNPQDFVTSSNSHKLRIGRKIGGGGYASVWEAFFDDQYLMACKIFGPGNEFDGHVPRVRTNANQDPYYFTKLSGEPFDNSKITFSIDPSISVNSRFNEKEANYQNGSVIRKESNICPNSKPTDSTSFIVDEGNFRGNFKGRYPDIFRYYPTPMKNRDYEAMILKALQYHRNIVQYFGKCSISDQQEALLLEYCTGGSLEQHVYNHRNSDRNFLFRDPSMCASTNSLASSSTSPGRLSRLNVVKIFSLVAHGMQHVHEKGYLHRDIKLSNILIDQDGVAKLADFGVSTPFAKGDSPSCLALYGNVYYAAPEVLRGQGFYPESDVWSFGVCFWEALTSKFAYDPLTSGNVYVQVANDSLNLPIPDDVPDDLKSLLQGILNPDFHLRPSFRAIAQTLDGIVSGSKTSLHTNLDVFFGAI